MNITIKSNAEIVFGNLTRRLYNLESNAAGGKEVMQTIAQNILPQMRQRIHTNGIAADGSAIGARSKQGGYLVSSGKLRDEFSVLSIGNNYSLGWNDTKQTDIATSIEKRYGKKIWNLAEEEKQTMLTTASEYLKRVFNV